MLTLLTLAALLFTTAAGSPGTRITSLANLAAAAGSVVRIHDTSNFQFTIDPNYPQAPEFTPINVTNILQWVLVPQTNTTFTIQSLLFPNMSISYASFGVPATTPIHSSLSSVAMLMLPSSVSKLSVPPDRKHSHSSYWEGLKFLDHNILQVVAISSVGSAVCLGTRRSRARKDELGHAPIKGNAGKTKATAAQEAAGPEFEGAGMPVTPDILLLTNERLREREIEGVLQALQEDYGPTFADSNKAFMAARKPFSDAEYEEVAAFFNLNVNTGDPFEGWIELDVPQMLLPKSVLREVGIRCLQSHVSPCAASDLKNEAGTAGFLAGPLQTLNCLFGGIRTARPKQHLPETVLSSGGRVEGEIF
ncbi:hypothetical protein B0H13DRAFT_2656670 [Mycena leptocephala]|nr:hypothetical protein B0H13DRAFT_2656670 [Mycena leptocephala]